MGDIADWMIDQAVDRGEWFSRRPRDTYIGRFACKHCGAPNLYWQRRDGRWLPFSRETLTQHVCAAPDKRTDEGFDDVA